MFGIHPKVAWTALVSALLTAASAILVAVGHPLDPSVAAAIVTVVAALTGYVAPSPAAVEPIVASTPQDSGA